MGQKLGFDVDPCTSLNKIKRQFERFVSFSASSSLFDHYWSADSARKSLKRSVLNFSVMISFAAGLHCPPAHAWLRFLLQACLRVQHFGQSFFLCARYVDSSHVLVQAKVRFSFVFAFDVACFLTHRCLQSCKMHKSTLLPSCDIKSASFVVRLQSQAGQLLPCQALLGVGNVMLGMGHTRSHPGRGRDANGIPCGSARFPLRHREIAAGVLRCCAVLRGGCF